MRSSAGGSAAVGGSAPRAPDGSGAGVRAGPLLQAWRAAGHEPRLRAPHPTESARPVPSHPATLTPGPAWPGPAVPDSRSAPLRDDYDKKVKQAAKEKGRRRHAPAPPRPRKPDLQVYLPRRRGEAARPACLQARAAFGPGPSASAHSPCLYGEKQTPPEGSVLVAPSRNLHLDAPPSPLRGSSWRTGRAYGPQLNVTAVGYIWEPARSCLPVLPSSCIFLFPLPNRTGSAQL